MTEETFSRGVPPYHLFNNNLQRLLHIGVYIPLQNFSQPKCSSQSLRTLSHLNKLLKIVQNLCGRLADH